jgi:hypothetical protein
MNYLKVTLDQGKRSKVSSLMLLLIGAVYLKSALGAALGGKGDLNLDNQPFTLKNVTITGKAFYNDQRVYGRFPIRKDTAGQTGKQYKVNDSRSWYTVTTKNRTMEPRLPGPEHTLNYLGLFEARVSIYEVDFPSSKLCLPEELQGTTTINNDGSWSWTGQIHDLCQADDNSETSINGNLGVSLAIKVSLEYCPENHSRCFAVKDPGGFEEIYPGFDHHGENAKTYEKWYQQATNLDPNKVYINNANVDMGRIYFETTVNSSADRKAQAAMVFSSTVDVTRKVHVDNDIDFKYKKYGGLTVIFPINFDYPRSHSHQGIFGVKFDSLAGDFDQDGLPNQICLTGPGTVFPVWENFANLPNNFLVDELYGPNGTDEVRDVPMSGWVPGDGVMHEYGHIVNFRAWDGIGKWVDYDLNDQTHESDSLEFKAAAFKEPWANFIKQVTVDDVTSVDTKDLMGCTTNTNFENGVSGALAACQSGTPCSGGEQSPDAVLGTLCDWYDSNNEVLTQSQNIWNANDNFNGSLRSVVDALNGAWNGAEQSKIEAYKQATESDSRVGDNGLSICDLSRAFTWKVIIGRNALTDTFAHNGIDCGIDVNYSPEVGNVPDIKRP